MAVPYTFGSATTSIPLSQLDSNFATTITLGNTAIQLGNTVTTLNNMTLPNATIASGNISASILTSGTVPSARQPTGSVLQVVNATYSTEVSTGSSTFSDTGLSASITPSSATNKILVLVDIQGTKNNNNTGLDLILVRGSTNILQFAKNAGYTGTTAYNIIGSVSCSYLDSPSTTSSTTYKVQFASNANLTNARINDNTQASTITLMEIAA
jgi:hypothetical protein